MLLALLVTQHPCAAPGIHLVDEGHVQMIGACGNEPLQEGRLGGILRLGLHLDGLLLLCVGDHVLPQGGDALFQLCGGQLPQVVKRVQIQPQQQRFLGKDFLRRHLQSAESVPEIVEIGVEGAPFRFFPDIVTFLAQMGQQAGIVPGVAELDAVQVGSLVKIHEFVVSLNSRLIGQGRHDALDGAGNSGRAEVPQDTDPLVAFLNVEIA